ncbi:chromatin modification- protein VID21 [Trapelia coarctata]|nr:chromatin modification- protein VID21 [Trapelia coarctata]
MIRDAILKTKRDELGRKRKLQELYHATVSLARPEPLQQNHNPDAKAPLPYSEAEFLEANNILEARFFDVATLRRLPGAELINYNDVFTPPATAKYSKGFDEISGGADKDTGTVASRAESIEPSDASRQPPTRDPEENGIVTIPNVLSRGTQADYIPEGLPSVGSDHTTAVAGQGAGPEPPAERPSILSRATSWLLNPHDKVGVVSRKSDYPQPVADLGAVGSRDQHNSTQNLPAQQPSDDIQKQHTKQSELPTGPSEVRKGDVSESTFLAQPTQGHLDSNSGSKNVIRQDGSPKEHGPVGHAYMSPPREQGNEDAKDPQDVTATSQGGAPSISDAQSRYRDGPFIKPSQPLDSVQRSAGLPGPQGPDQPVQGKSGKTGATPNFRDQVDQACGNLEDSRLLGRRTQPPQERRIPGTTRDVSKDLMFSQRPPMRIDTGVSSLRGIHDSYEKTRQQGSIDTQTPSSASTPLKATPTTAHASPPERMTTRVSSGALRHKSVSEILGETPRTATHQGDRTPMDRGNNEQTHDSSGQHTPRYGQLVSSPESQSFRSRLNELTERDKQRSKLSTVVFARQQPPDSARILDSSARNASDSEKHSHENKDYLLTLFTAQASAQQPSLNTLLGSAHKTLSTGNHYLEFHEQQDCRILKRIYHLQNSNRWSLRQLERSVEPQRPTAHWDILLGHIKWLQTDFREERKWKLAAAKNLADWSAEWVASSPSRRASLQVARAKSTGKSRGSESHATPVSLNGGTSRSEMTPELVHSAEDDLSDITEESVPHLDVSQTPAPAAIFSLAPEEVIFTLDKTPVSDKLLAELPLYRSLDTAAEVVSKAETLDRNWKTPLVPISKFATGKMIIRTSVPPRKRSRYDYEEDDKVEQDSHASNPISPEKNDVALFNPENKHIIDRLHAAHAFRPPSEFSMPSQSFFESRHCSQWTWSEDNELRRLVKEYAYNWSLISSCLSSPSMFSSGAERRTPWECFERWVSFEGLPGDMNRTQYFRTWHSRRDAARSLLNQQIAAQQQQATSSQQTQIRRRTVEPMRVERRRNSKHMALVQAMHKVARKKETTLQKQQHVASLAAMRKATEAAQPKQRMQTPQEFSRFKHERELRIQEKQEVYRQQMMQQQRAALIAKATQSGALPGGPNMPQQMRNPVPGPSNGTSPHLASSLPANGVPAGHGPSRSIPSVNGMLPNGAPTVNGQNGLRGGNIPQAPMQSHAQGQQRMPHDMRIMMEASRLQAEQQQYLQAQRQQRYPSSNGANGHSSSPQAAAMNNTAQPSAAMLASLQAANGKLSPTANGISGPPRLSSSPQLANAVQARQLSSGVVPLVSQIATQLKAAHPNASDEQLRQMATERMTQQLRSQTSQAAMHAAAGNNLPTNGMGAQLPQPGMGFGNTMLNPQIYAQYMHSQQSSQQNRGGVNGINGVRPSSRGNTPQMRNGSSQAGTSQSPRPPQAQMAGTQ